MSAAVRVHGRAVCRGRDRQLNSAGVTGFIIINGGLAKFDELPIAAAAATPVALVKGRVWLLRGRGRCSHATTATGPPGKI